LSSSSFADRLAVVLFISGLVFYMGHFTKTKFSLSPVYVGKFGDFFDGLLNPLFGLINVLVLVSITIAGRLCEDDCLNQGRDPWPYWLS